MTDAAESDPYTRFQGVMIVVHQALKKGLESAIAHLEADQERIDAGKPSTLAGDLPVWLGYVGAWNSMLIAHHDTEETCIFPVFNANGVNMDDEHEAHVQLHAHLDVIDARLKEWSAAPASYDGAVLLKLLKDVQQPLVQHLNDEVAKLAKEHVQPHITPSDLQRIDDESKKYAKAHAPTSGLPFLFHHLSAEQKVKVKEQPFFFTYVLIPALNLLHMRLWKYAPYQLYK